MEELEQLTENISTVLKNQKTNSEEISNIKTQNEQLRTELKEVKAKAGRQSGGNQQPDFGSVITEALTENKDNFEKFKRKDIKEFSFEVKAVGDMSFAGNFANAGASITDVRPGIVTLGARRWHMRDIIPNVPLSTSNYDFVKELSTGEGAPTPVSEAGTKPQVDIDISEVSLPSQTIACWLRISDRLLDDVSGMRNFLQFRLFQKLMDVEDSQIITGDGIAPNLSGFGVAGNFTAYSGSGTDKISKLVEAVAQVAAMNRNPTAILLNPVDYFSIPLNVTADDVYTLPTIVTSSPEGMLRVLGIPVIWTAAVASGAFLVGDFATGAALAQRYAPRIEFFTGGATEITKNQIIVRAELREVFAVFGATFFVKGSFS